MDNPPLLYYRSREQIEAYRRLPAEQKVRKLEMEMELLHYIRQERDAARQNIKNDPETM